jgi:hypothetical protein
MFVVIHAMTAQAANIIAVTDCQSLSVFDGTLLVLLQALCLCALAHDALHELELAGSRFIYRRDARACFLRLRACAHLHMHVMLIKESGGKAA